MEFLVTFKRFMIMNQDSAIAKDHYRKCAYFIGHIRGQKTRGWVQRNYDWLDRVEADPEELYGDPPGQYLKKTSNDPLWTMPNKRRPMMTFRNSR